MGGVPESPGKLHARERLVADDPGIVAGLDVIRLSGPEMGLSAILADHMKVVREDVTNVVHLARVRLRDWVHAPGPFPPPLEGIPTDRPVTDLHDLGLAVIEGPCLIGAVHGPVQHALSPPPLWRRDPTPWEPSEADTSSRYLAGQMDRRSCGPWSLGAGSACAQKPITHPFSLNPVDPPATPLAVEHECYELVLGRVLRPLEFGGHLPGHCRDRCISVVVSGLADQAQRLLAQLRKLAGGPKECR